MIRLLVFEALNNKERISSIDVFRGIAIISVVIFHFNNQLPFGFLGVDLFFLVSGLLIGGLLNKEFRNERKINFFHFFLQRGFKIWPSYYFFILVGNLIAWCFYNSSNPEQIIRWDDLKQYVFFYRNYTGMPFHWSFDHLWSLCVEEHFYILLPILFILIQKYFYKNHKNAILFSCICLTIITGFIFKYISFYYTNSKDTYSGTHNRIDALAWGVLLNLLITYYGKKIKSRILNIIFFMSGLAIFILAIYLSVNLKSEVFNKIYLHSIIPISFFLMLLGLYYVDFSKLKIIRFIAYYSYNWYLWHPVFVIFITQKFGNTITGLLLYLIVTFILAIVSTIFIEEFFLQKRKIILKKIFKS